MPATARILVVDDGAGKPRTGGHRAGRVRITRIEPKRPGRCRHGAVRDYDLILMDMQIPVMDGFTATRTPEAGFETPIVALTANAVRGFEQK